MANLRQTSSPFLERRPEVPFPGSGRWRDFRLDEEPHDALLRQCGDLVACPVQVGAADPGDDAAGCLHDRIKGDDPDPASSTCVAAGAVMALPHTVPVAVRPIRELPGGMIPLAEDIADLVVPHPKKDVAVAPKSLDGSSSRCSRPA